MRINVDELPESRVRIEVGIEPEEVERRVRQAAARVGREMKMPGFRKGKVPAEIVLQRVGREALVREALEGSLGEWYERALLETGIDPIGEPKLDIGSLPAQGEELAFSIEVAVRPRAKLGDYEGLEVGRAEPEVPVEAVDSELERLRNGFATLKPVEREAGEGDLLLIDYRGTIEGEQFEGGSARDYLVELGAGQLPPELEAALMGAKAGDERTATVSFPDDHQAEEIAGKQAEFEIEVKEVREKELPELDDDFASEASEFDTLAELRGNIEDRIREALDSRVREQFRIDALDAAVDNATVELPEGVATARAGEMWSRVERRLAARGINPDTYLQAQGKTRDEVIAEARLDAARELKREAVLDAIADAEGVEVSEEEMIESLEHTARHEGTTPEKLLDQLRKSGRDALLRRDLRFKKALDIVADRSRPIPAERAAAREKLWTPEKEEGKPAELWTPGQGSPGPRP